MGVSHTYDLPFVWKFPQLLGAEEAALATRIIYWWSAMANNGNVCDSSNTVRTESSSFALTRLSQIPAAQTQTSSADTVC
jgi:hypothetical protein